MTMAKHIVVVGAGIIGSCTALELLTQGHRVTILDPCVPGGPQSASYGNGTWISPGSIIPVVTPGLWRQVPALLLDRNGPLVVRKAQLVSHLPWLVRVLLANATKAKVAATAGALGFLLVDAPDRYRHLAATIGRTDLMLNKGLLLAYSDRQAFEAEAFFWQLRRESGLRWTELDQFALRQREPFLSDDYRFGILVDDGNQCINPGEFVSEVVSAAVEAGATHDMREAIGLDIDSNGRVSVRTRSGEILCDYVVIAAGVHSKMLAAQAGDKIPMMSERGYHAVIKNPKVWPHSALMALDSKMSINTTPSGLRLAGQVEIAGLTAPPDWNRVELMIDRARKIFPGLGVREDMDVERWMGHRPSTSDGLPVIGASRRSKNVLYAFGHGHIGLTAAPKTASIVANLVAGHHHTQATRAFDPERFR
ncbi:NAD(P)/FAD-dependent oxidoreductase [Burkholderia sp. MR1-5-21]